MKIEIPKNVLRALAQAVSKDKFSPNLLQGICLQPDPKGGVWAVATNTIVLAAYHLPDAEIREEAILPIEALKTIIKKTKRTDAVVIKMGDGTASVTDIDTETTRTAVLIDAEFPDWKPVIPNINTDRKNEKVFFHPDQMAKIWKAAKELTGVATPEFPAIHTTGDNRAAVVSISDYPGFVGLIMPFKSSTEGERGNPDWAYHRLK